LPASFEKPTLNVLSNCFSPCIYEKREQSGIAGGQISLKMEGKLEAFLYHRDQTNRKTGFGADGPMLIWRGSFKRN
jgi:hypothetical protein